MINLYNHGFSQKLGLDRKGHSWQRLSRTPLTIFNYLEQLKVWPRLIGSETDAPSASRGGAAEHDIRGAIDAVCVVGVPLQPQR